VTRSESIFAIADHASAAPVRLRIPAPRWLKSEVRIEGQDKIYARMADSGFEIRFHFCPNCGSSVFWEGDRGPDYYGIAVGCFADPNFPPPVYSAYEEAMHPWLTATTAREHYPHARPANLPLIR
jgi:hypothetical protein